jgi:hypothetical protein
MWRYKAGLAATPAQNSIREKGIRVVRWTRKSIVAEIRQLHAKGIELNYATAEAEYLNLVRAAAWHFGTWRRAVEAADIDYESICKYRRWDRQRIVARIRELNSQGADLSWRTVSTIIDPKLAAATLRPNGFRSWREAIEAAGLDIGTVSRYQWWNNERVLRAIKDRKKAGEPLSSKAVQVANQPLFCAARRLYGSWDAALGKAGLDPSKIRLRRPPKHPSAGRHLVPAAATAKPPTKKTASKRTAAPAAGPRRSAISTTSAKAAKAAIAARDTRRKPAAARATPATATREKVARPKVTRPATKRTPATRSTTTASRTSNAARSAARTTAVADNPPPGTAAKKAPTKATRRAARPVAAGGTHGR